MLIASLISQSVYFNKKKKNSLNIKAIALTTHELRVLIAALRMSQQMWEISMRLRGTLSLFMTLDDYIQVQDVSKKMAPSIFVIISKPTVKRSWDLHTSNIRLCDRHVQNFRENDGDTLKWRFEVQRKYFFAKLRCVTLSFPRLHFPPKALLSTIESLFFYTSVNDVTWQQLNL